MARPQLPDLSALARPGAEIALRVTPGARHVALEAGAPLKVWVSEKPEEGRATEAARKLLAKALGVAPSRLTLLRGASARDKLFRLD